MRSTRKFDIDKAQRAAEYAQELWFASGRTSDWWWHRWLTIETWIYWLDVDE